MLIVDGRCPNFADCVRLFQHYYCFKYHCLVFFIFELFSAGKMRGIAFIKDPDGYWIEIFDLKGIGSVTESAS